MDQQMVHRAHAHGHRTMCWPRTMSCSPRSRSSRSANHGQRTMCRWPQSQASKVETAWLGGPCGHIAQRKVCPPPRACPWLDFSVRESPPQTNSYYGNRPSHDVGLKLVVCRVQPRCALPPMRHAHMRSESIFVCDLKHCAK